MKLLLNMRDDPLTFVILNGGSSLVSPTPRPTPSATLATMIVAVAAAAPQQQPGEQNPCAPNCSGYFACKNLNTGFRMVRIKEIIDRRTDQTVVFSGCCCRAGGLLNPQKFILFCSRSECKRGTRCRE